jgi:HYR domain-containing protein/PKD domain-containing protein
VLTAPAAVARGTGPGATICGVLLSDADLGLATATDNCSGTTILRSGVPAGNIFPAGSTTITYTATDDAGNSSTATQVVTVTDNTPPVIITWHLSVSTDHGLCSAVVAHGTSATDNCGTPTLTGTRSDGLLLTDAYPKGVTTISWLATDGSGNTAAATQTITVSDTEHPTIATTNLSVFTDPSLCSAVVAHGTTADDNCPGVVLTGTRSDGLLLTDPYPDGITTISWLATDTSGNTATAAQTIEVKDNENPTLTPPPGITTSTGPLATICGKLIGDGALGTATAHDNCSVTVTRTGVPAGNIFPVGSTTITYTATDPTGNAVSGTQVITVVDDTNPVITTANINANTDGGLCAATVAHGTTATDNCGTPTLTGTRSDGLLLTDAYPKGVTTISWLATDAHLNSATATQTITVIDNEPPVVTPPAAISVNTGPDATICGLLIPDTALGTALATDNCSVTVTRTGVPSGNIFPVGSTTLTYTAMDPSGNTTTVTQVVTVSDDTPPVLAAPAAINAVTGSSATICGRMISDATLGAPVASDNCSVTVTRTGVPTGNIFPVGTTTITYTAKDPSGNTTVQTQVVTVVDNTPPAITTANISVPTGTGVCTATIASLGTTATDNCGTATLVGTRGDGLPLADPYPKGTTTITWVATDGNGNTANATQTVEVTNPPPVATITAPASGFIIGVGQTVAFAGSFSDNTGDVHTVQWTCDVLTFAGTVNEAARTTAGSFTFGAAGVYSVKMTVKDQCNQASTATQVAGVDAMVVVYDPSAGFVTGGGWINSPPGAYPADPSLVGKANFGFVSKYKKGQSTPSAPEGETEFQFKAGSLNFHSTSYEWLVISGAKAQFKGWGTINDTGSYGFMLTSTDGQVNGGGGQDKFRMKITNKVTGVVVYDSQLGASDTDAATTLIAGGSIVIHTSSGFLTAEAPGFETAAVTTAIHQNTPNPFNPSTTLRFSVADPGRVSIRVFNVRGELVTTLRDDWVTPGAYEVHWDGKDRMGRAVSSGAYFAVMSNDRGYRDRIRMVLLK